MNAFSLTDDAKAILLLCGRFQAGSRPDSAKPLTLAQYNRLADWMRDVGIRPENLIAGSVSDVLTKAPADIDSGRVGRLLERGAAMALAVEKWSQAGIWVMCRSDRLYPERLKRHLRKKAPPILYGVGDHSLLERGGMAMVGSRKVDSAGEKFTREAAGACARQGIQVVSGGARGVDQTAMLAALEAGGTVAGALADGLLKAAVAKKYRDFIRERRLVLVSAFSPHARFYVYNAMDRNKHIYALADYALVVSSDEKSGGTWAGATEELKRDRPIPVFVRTGDVVPAGNRALLDMGAQPFPNPPWGGDLRDRLAGGRTAYSKPLPGVQQPLFGDPAASATPAPALKEERSEYRADPRLPERSPTGGRGAGSDLPAGIFDAVLPLLLNALNEWKSPKDLSAELGVRKNQLGDWLKQAMEQGLVRRKERPVRYRKT